LKSKLARHYNVGTFAEDMIKLQKDPNEGEGDGRVYVVKGLFGQYVVFSDPGGSTYLNASLKNAKRFYDGQAAWGVARRQIYPAYVLLLEEEEKRVMKAAKRV
jgi:hypothetical protein